METKVQTKEMVELRMKPTKFMRFLRFVVIILGAFVAQVIGVAFAYIFLFSSPTLDIDMLSELSLAAVFIACLLLFGGKKLLAYDAKSFMRQLKYLRGYLICALLLIVFELPGLFADFASGTINLLDFGIYHRFFNLIFTCIGIGIFEECYFRGLVQNGFMAWLGSDKIGLRWAYILSALTFGVMHISFSEIAWSDPLQVLQVILKILQVGVMGLSLNVIVSREKNLWGAAAYHALHDFILLFSSYVFYDLSAQPTYVDTSQETAWQTIATYAIIILMYTPMAVRAICDLMEIEGPDFGVLFARGKKVLVSPSDAEELIRESKVNEAITPKIIYQRSFVVEPVTETVAPTNYTMQNNKPVPPQMPDQE